MRKLSLALAFLSALLGHSPSFAEYANVVPIGWVTKSQVVCQETSDNICRVNLPDHGLLPIFSLPGGKIPLAQLQDITPVKKLDEKGNWIFVGLVAEGSCLVGSDENNTLFLDCPDAPKD